MPTWGMAIGFIAGLAIGYLLGIPFIVTASNLASEFFLSMGVIVGTAFGIVLLVMIAILLFKAWYFMAPFIIGLVFGVVINMSLDSTFYDSLTSIIGV